MSIWEWEVMKGKKLVASGTAESGKDARESADAVFPDSHGVRRFAEEAINDGTAEMWMRVQDGQWERYQ